MKKTIKGNLNYKLRDKLMCRFEMELDDKAENLLRTNRIITFGRDMLPDDFEPDLYDVTGEFSFTVEATRKPKKK